MRFILLMIPAVYQGGRGNRVGADFTPPADAVERMSKFNEALVKAGALISLDGLHPIEKGARVTFSDSTPHVIEGASLDNTEVVGGYWMIQCQSKREAIEWAKRIPAEKGDVIEIRQMQELSDFPEDVQKAAGALSS